MRFFNLSWLLDLWFILKLSSHICCMLVIFREVRRSLYIIELPFWCAAFIHILSQRGFYRSKLDVDSWHSWVLMVSLWGFMFSIHWCAGRLCPSNWFAVLGLRQAWDRGNCLRLVSIHHCETFFDILYRGYRSIRLIDSPPLDNAGIC